ncbi:MAG TPA: isoamylase early set domain-containing protein [Actinomycetes bacterium]|nr:isoamylase early set domain-containing protein [Actinomycetes bacterium]
MVDVLKSNGSNITFVLPEDVGQVSVVGDWNGWDPLAHPLRRRSNATVSVKLGPGAHAFRYLADGGRWLDERDASVEPDSHGTTRSVVVVG